MANTPLVKTYQQFWKNKNGTANTARIFRKFQSGVRQDPITPDPQPYILHLENASGSPPIQNPQVPSANTWYVDAPNTPLAYKLQQVFAAPSGVAQVALNKAYGDLLDNFNEYRAGLGETFAEGREAIKMIWQRARVLAKAYGHLKKGRFRRFLQVLSIRANRRHRSKVWNRPRDASSLWLEYWLGWAPLIGDIHSAMETLVNPFPWGRITGRGSALEVWRYSRSTKDFDVVQNCDLKFRARMATDVLVTNPNLFLADNVGLLNPAAVAWALVPLSFIVDWFIDVGQFLNSLTDFAGTSFRRSWTTLFIKANPTGYQTGKGALRGKFAPRDEHLCYVRRWTSIVKPIPTFMVPMRLGVTRAATAISLLVLLFTSKK